LHIHILWDCLLMVLQAVCASAPPATQGDAIIRFCSFIANAVPRLASLDIATCAQVLPNVTSTLLSYLRGERNMQASIKPVASALECVMSAVGPQQVCVKPSC